MISLRNDKFLEDLTDKEKKWFARAIIAMVCSDKNVDEEELQFIEMAFDLCQTEEELDFLSEFVLDLKSPPMQSFQPTNKLTGYFMLEVLASISLIDGSISPSEIKLITRVAQLLGFEEKFATEVANLTLEKLKILQKDSELRKKADRVL